MTPDKVLQIVKDFFARNFSSGNPQIPAHQHNGIDNLPIAISDVTGNVVNKLVAGSNITISPSTGTGTVTVTASGGGGGSPGGNNTDVQFNDSAAFGGNDTFTFNKATNILTLDDASGTGSSGGSVISGGISRLSINTSNRSGSSVTTGDVKLVSGNASGTYGKAGSIVLTGGNNSGTLSTGAGNVTLTGGNSAGYKTPGGGINLISGNGTYAGYGYGGDISLKTGSGTKWAGRMIFTILKNSTSLNGYFWFKNFDVSDIIQPNMYIGNATPAFGGGKGVVVIHNASTNPTAAASNAGILYVDSGALKYIGSAGTSTTIAVA